MWFSNGGAVLTENGSDSSGHYGNVRGLFVNPTVHTTTRRNELKMSSKISVWYGRRGCCPPRVERETCGRALFE